MMSPALGIYSWFPAIQGAAGDVVPFVFIVALLVSLPTAASYALISRSRPSAGSAYTWVSETTRHQTGTWLGIVMALYYFGVVSTMPVQFALYFADFLNYLGIGSGGYGIFAIGVILSTGLVAALAYPDVGISAKGALVFMAFEAIVVVALSVTVGVRHSGELSLGPLNPGNAVGGTSAIFAALIFGVLAFTGYDAATTVAEEAKAPRRMVPAAVAAALVLTAAFWIVTSYLLSYSASPSQVAKFVSEGVTPFGPIAKIYWHGASVLVDLTGMTASLGVYIASTVGIARIIYAMGRDSVLPNALGRLHPRHRTPWNAMHLLFGVTVIVNLVAAAILGIYNALLWLGAATVWFALITYLFVNIANLLLHRKRPAEFNWFANGVVPVVGVVVTVYLIYKGFFVAYWNAGFKLGQSVVLVSLLLTVLAWIYAWMRFRSATTIRLVTADDVDVADS